MEKELQKKENCQYSNIIVYSSIKDAIPQPQGGTRALFTFFFKNKCCTSVKS